MIIRMNRPLANDHQEGPASCKKLSDTPVTLVTSARIQIQSRGPFWNNLFLFSLYSCVRLCANYFPVTQEPFLTLMKFLSPGNRVVLSRRLTGTMFWKCFCPLQEFKSLVSFTSQLSQMFREDQWEWWGDKGPVWEHVRQVPWKPGKVSLSKLTICKHFFLFRMLRSRLATYSDHSLLSNRFFLCQNMNFRR